MTLIEKPATPHPIISTKKTSFPSLSLSSSSSNPPSTLSSPTPSSALLSLNLHLNNPFEPFDLDSFFSTFNSNVNPSNPPAHDLFNPPLKKLRTLEGPCSCSSSLCSSHCSASLHSYSSSSSALFDPSSPSTPPPTPLPPFSGSFPFSLDCWEARSFDLGKDLQDDVFSLSALPSFPFSQNDLSLAPACSYANEQQLKPEEARLPREEEPLLLSPLLPEDSLATPSSSSLSPSDLDEPSLEEVPFSPLSVEKGKKRKPLGEEEFEDEHLGGEENEESEGSEGNEEGEEGEEGEEWTAPRRPRPGLSLTKEEIEMALNCYSYLFASLKNKKKACQEVGSALKIGSRKVFELVQQREILVQKGAPANCIPKARIEKKRGKAREKAIGETHLALIRKELSLHHSKSGNFPPASQILCFLASLPSPGLPLLHLELSSPGPLHCNLKTLKGHLTRLRREILSSTPSF